MKIPSPANISPITLALGLIAIFLTIVIISTDTPFGASVGDLAAYYNAAVSFTDGANPYQVTAGTVGNPLYVPPWGFFSFLWMSLLPIKAVVLILLILSVVITSIVSTTMLRWQNANRKEALLCTVFLITFIPFWTHLYLGQISLLILFFLFVFISNWASQSTHRNQIVSGFFLALTLAKPHLLCALVFATLINAFKNRLFPFLIAFFATAVLMLAIPLFFNSQIYELFINAQGTSSINWFTATPSAWLAHLFQAPILRFVPVVIALLVTGIFFARSNESLSTEKLMLLLCVSILSAPYAWPYDFVLLIPVAIQAFSTTRSIAAVGSLLIGANLFLWMTLGEMQYVSWYPIFLITCYISFAPRNMVK